MSVGYSRGNLVVSSGVASVDGPYLLKKFVYTPDCRVRIVLPFNFDIDSVTYALTLRDDAMMQLWFISGVTHIGLTYGVFDFDFETLDYKLHLAAPLILDKTFATPTVTLVPDTLLTRDGTVLCVLGVRI